MLRITHKIIAEKIASNLSFSPQNSNIFVDGVLGPDTHGDFPHKTGKDSKILQKISEARQIFFLNDDCSYGELGTALHYIQDKWVDDFKFVNQTNLPIDDDSVFTEKIEHKQMPENLKQEYLKIAKMLFRIKDFGIDSWFNHQWGIWHKDFASCVLVFADIVEIMMSTLQPKSTILNDKTKLKQYVLSEAFKTAINDGFFASLKTNYLYPKIQGYTAAMFTLSLVSPPSNQNYPEINLQIVYRLSQEIARYTLAKPEQFNYPDDWTHKIDLRPAKIGLLKPHYLTLIERPIQEVHKERLFNFFGENQHFQLEYLNIQNTLSTIKRSETWKIILSELMEILKREENRLLL